MSSRENEESEEKSTKQMDSKYLEFSDIPGMPDFLIKQLDKLGVIRPTPVQAGTIPEAMKGYDVIGAARTGQGKTLCFVVPILASLAEEPGAFRGLVLTPTRELALQIAQQFQVLAENMKVRIVTIIGGMDMVEQQRQLATKPHILIASPGRLAQIIKEGTVAAHMASLRRLQFFVLDEADRLLSPEFAESLATIVSWLPTSRQTLLYSATLTQNIKNLMNMHQNGSEQPKEGRKKHIYQDLENVDIEATKVVEVENGQEIEKWPTPETLDMQYMFMPQNVKDCYLLFLIRQHLADLPTGLIVFAPTCQSCEEITAMLNFAEPPIGAVRLHRWMKQRDRTNALQQFKQGTSKVLVATDLASRGLDVPDVFLVIQYNVPADPRDYIHRVGRVARRGRLGHSILLIDQHQVNFFLRIERHLLRPVTEYQIEEKRVLAYLNEAITAREMGRLDLDDAGFYERLELLKSQKESWDYEKKTNGANNASSSSKTKDDDGKGKTREKNRLSDAHSSISEEKMAKRRRHAEDTMIPSPKKKSQAPHEKEKKRKREHISSK